LYLKRLIVIPVIAEIPFALMLRAVKFSLSVSVEWQAKHAHQIGKNALDSRSFYLLARVLV